jgi:hypothetical protein
MRVPPAHGPWKPHGLRGLTTINGKEHPRVPSSTPQNFRGLPPPFGSSSGKVSWSGFGPMSQRMQSTSIRTKQVRTSSPTSKDRKDFLNAFASSNWLAWKVSVRIILIQSSNVQNSKASVLFDLICYARIILMRNAKLQRSRTFQRQ